MDTFFEDLTENLRSYYDGFVAILPKLALAILLFTILFFVANQSKRIVNNNLTKRMDDPLLARFLARMVKTAIVIIALLIVMRIVGLTDVAAGLLTGASVSAIVVGFAFKDIGENLLAGIMLAFNRPFRVGDTVELDGHTGTVVALDMRVTRIKTFDGKDVYIPNASVIKNPVVNFTIDGFLRQEFDIGLDYGEDVSKAKSIILDTLQNINGLLKKDKAPNVIIGSLGTSTLNLTVQYWLDTFDKNVSGAQVKVEAVSKVIKALDDAGFYLPADIIELKNYNNSKLDYQEAQ